MTGATAPRFGLARRATAWAQSVFRGRIMQGMIANVVAQLVLIVPQITIPSALLYTFGAEQAGAWLLAVTVTGLLLLSDLGVTMTVSARLLQLKARSDLEEASKQYTTSLVLVIGCGFASAWLCAALIIALPLSSIPALASLQPDRPAVLLCLTGACLASLLTTYFTLLVRADDRYASAAYAGSLFAAAEFATTLALILGDGSLLDLAIGLLAIRVASLIGSAAYARRTIGWMRWNGSGLTLPRLLDQLRSCAAFSVIPATQALLLSGPLVMLGATGNAANVALFFTLRTLSRAGLQAQLVVSHAIMPEYGKAVARRDSAMARKLIQRSLLASAGMGIPFIIAMSLFGLPLYHLWTHNAVEAPQALIVIFAVQAALGALWNVLLNLIYAAGRHASLVGFLVPGGLVFVPLCYGLTTQFGAHGGILAVVAFDALILLACIRALRRSAKDDAASPVAAPDRSQDTPTTSRSCEVTA
jgi:O-antigen/teichoic acid export membrane protein